MQAKKIEYKMCKNNISECKYNSYTLITENKFQCTNLKVI